MKRMLTIAIATMAILACTVIPVLADNTTSLDAVISGNQTTATTTTPTTTTVTTPTQGTTSSDQSFLDGMSNSTDLSADTVGATAVTAPMKKYVTFVVQVLAYAATSLLALRVVIDLLFIGIPFLRKFLANGYMGNAQAGAGGMPNGMGGGMQGGMGGMGGGMGGMGGMGMHNRMGGMGGMGGMQGGMGGMGMGGGQQGMGGPQQSGQQQMMGKIQWVSNAALNAIAGETTVGPDGHEVSPFKVYIKDMVVVLILVPVLLTLTITGVLTTLGFEIGSMLGMAIRNLKGMM